MAFGSVAGEFKSIVGNATKFLKLHGQIYHRVSALHPMADHPPAYGQLYIVDTAEALQERTNHVNRVHPNMDPLNLNERENQILREV